MNRRSNIVPKLVLGLFFGPMLYLIFTLFAVALRLQHWVSDGVLDDKISVLGVTAKIQSPRASFDPNQFWWRANSLNAYR